MWWDQPGVLLQRHDYQSVLFAVQIYLLVGVVWSLYERSLLPLLVMFAAAVLLTLMKKDNRDELSKIIQEQPAMSYQINRNPMPFGDYAAAIRSQVPPLPCCYDPAEELRRLYTPVTEWPTGFRMNPLPDPTLMARQPFWPISSEMDRNIMRDTNILRYA